MKKDLYAFTDYKKYLKFLLDQGDKSWGLVSKLADACGCQRSYFSRVVNAEVHLTPDHAYNLSQYLSLAETETEYFLCLLEKDRASTSSYRERQMQKIKRMKEEHEDLQKIVNRPPVSLSEKEFQYYATWYMSALHILVSIPKYQTSASIAQKLQLDLASVEEALLKLQAFGLVRYENKKWTFNSSEIHVSKNSPLVSLHHNNWRQRAILDSQKTKTDGIHFTVVQSVDKEAWEKIKNKLLQFIEDFSKTAGPAASEELICMTCDFFKV